MKTSDFDYYLPPELIAQTPTEPRDHSRLMVLSRKDRSIQHRRFFDSGLIPRDRNPCRFQRLYRRNPLLHLADQQEDGGADPEISLAGEEI